MSSSLSDLELKKIKVLSSILFVNDEVDYSSWKKENSIEFGVSSTLSVEKDAPNSGRLVLEVQIFDEDFMENDNPFHFDLTMAFYFEDNTGDYGENEEFDNVTSKFAVNMISMGYPYIRSHISTVTAISGIEQVNIPTVNVRKMLKEKKIN